MNVLDRLIDGVERWATFLTVVHGRFRPRVVETDIHHLRERQRAALREAFLADQPPHRRAHYAPNHGDIH